MSFSEKAPNAHVKNKAPVTWGRLMEADNSYEKCARCGECSLSGSHLFDHEWVDPKQQK